MPLPPRRAPRKPLRPVSRTRETKTAKRPDPPVSMANSRDEILEAAVDAGLADRERLDVLTKSEMLELWEKR